jgi:hypothetical protein
MDCTDDHVPWNLYHSRNIHNFLDLNCPNNIFFQDKRCVSNLLCRYIVISNELRF